MVGEAADRRVVLQQMVERSRQIEPRGHKNGEMIQPRRPLNRSRSRLPGKQQETVVPGSQAGRLARALQQRQADDVFVEAHRAIQIGHGQGDAADARRRHGDWVHGISSNSIQE